MAPKISNFPASLIGFSNFFNIYICIEMRMEKIYVNQLVVITIMPQGLNLTSKSFYLKDIEFYSEDKREIHQTNIKIVI